MMATPLENDTVWIGFMDIVPVIGTVKEAVELVLAVYEGNKAVIKEKEKALENSVKESFKKDKSTLSDKPAAAVDEYSGLRNVREVKEEMIIECMMEGSRRGAIPLTPAQKKQRVEDIRKDMLEKIRIVDPDFKEELKKELKEELGRSKKGEHVFNNDILKFHSKVVNDLITIRCINNPQEYKQYHQAVTELDGHTLSQNTEKDIGKKMVVDFDEDEFYVNANAVEYGEYCRVLTEAMIAVLNHIKPEHVTEGERQRNIALRNKNPERKTRNEIEWVNFVIENMNDHEIYVDKPAKVKWIGKKVTKQADFKRVKEEVACMYKTDRGVDWCIRVLNKIWT